MNKSDSIVEISKALAKFQSEVKQPFKNADNPFFKSKYVPLEEVVDSITNVAPNHGLSFVQWALNDDSGRVGVATMLMHESGEFIEFDPVFMNAEKNTPQGAGSLITYLKRYSLSAVFGITSDNDDDANESSGNKQQDEPKATNGQLDYVTKLLEGKAKTATQSKEELYKILKNKIGTQKDMENWTKQQASKAIEILNGGKKSA